MCCTDCSFFRHIQFGLAKLLGPHFCLLGARCSPASAIAKLKEWVADEHGRQTRLAGELGTSRQRVNGWFLGTPQPTLAMWIKIRAFLQKTSNQAEVRVRIPTLTAPRSKTRGGKGG